MKIQLRVVRGLCVFTAITLGFISRGAAAAVGSRLSDAPGNVRWHAAEEAGTLSFLGGDQKERAVVVFKKPSLLGTTLSIGSDSAKLFFHSGDSAVVTVTVPGAADGATTSIALLPGTPPSFTVNGVAAPAYQEKWREIVESKSPTLTIELEGTTFATFKFADAAGSPASTASEAVTTTSGGPGKVTPTVAPKVASVSHDPQEIVKHSVLQIQDLDKENHPYFAGSGFILTDDGFVVTNFHVIQGATSAQAIFGDKSKPVPLELWSVEPEQDLALLKLPEAKSGDEYLPLQVGGLPREGDVVWALGNSPGAGPFATKGVVKGVHDLATLDAKLRDEFSTLGGETRWVQSDIMLNPSNTGGPLVNARGQVVGINTWLWTGGKNVNAALSAGHLGQLMRHRVNDPMKFAGATDAFAAATSAWTYIPRQPIAMAGPELLKPVTTAAARSASKALTTGIRRNCAHCNGTGKVSVNQQTGTYYNGGVPRPVYTTVVQNCDRCKGTGVERATDDAIIRLTGNLVRSLTLLKADDPNTPDAASEAVQAIQDTVLTDQKALVSVVSRGKAILGQHTLEPGTAVLTKVIVKQVLPIDAHRRDFVVQIPGADRLALIVDPPPCDANVSSALLVGGLITGPGMSPTGTQQTAIIHAGYLTPAPGGLN